MLKLWKHIFVAEMLLQDQNDLILRQRFSNTFLCYKQQKAFSKHLGPLTLFSLRFQYNILHC